MRATAANALVRAGWSPWEVRAMTTPAGESTLATETEHPMPRPTATSNQTSGNPLDAFDHYPGHHVVVTHRIGPGEVTRQTRGRLAVDDHSGWLRLGDPMHLDGHPDCWMSNFPRITTLRNVVSIEHATDCTNGHPCHADPSHCWACAGDD